MRKIARIFGQLRTVAPAGGRIALGMAANGSGKLVMNIPNQEQDNWCWAAVAVGIGDFLLARQTQQCAFASDVLGMASGACCGTQSGGPCDKQWYLDRALSKVGCFERLDVPASFADVGTEIDDGHPLGVRIRWSNGSGHFVAITAYRTGGSGAQIVTVQDPWGPKELDYEIGKLNGQYGTSSGSWTHSYYTSANPTVGGAAPDKADHQPELLGG